MALKVMNGIYTPDLLGYTVIGLVAVIAGKMAGSRIVDCIDTVTMKKIVYVFFGLSGIVTLL